MQVGFLRGCHAGMPQPPCYACNGYPCKQKHRSVGMPQTMYRDDRDLGPVAVPFQNIVDGGIVGVFLEHENRLIFRNVLYQCGELDHRLPVDLNFTDRRFIFCRQKSTVPLIIPRFIDGKHLMRKVKIRRSNCQSFGKADASFGNQQNHPVPVEFSL